MGTTSFQRGSGAQQSGALRVGGCCSALAYLPGMSTHDRVGRDARAGVRNRNSKGQRYCHQQLSTSSDQFAQSSRQHSSHVPLVPEGNGLVRNQYSFTITSIANLFKTPNKMPRHHVPLSIATHAMQQKPGYKASGIRDHSPTDITLQPSA